MESFAFYDTQESVERPRYWLAARGYPMGDLAVMALLHLLPVYVVEEERPLYAVESYSYDVQTNSVYKIAAYREKTALELQSVLEQEKRRKREEFAAVFLHLESRAARAVSSLTLRMADGETAFPDDDFDAGLLWSIEQIKQANRDLLAGLEALAIPDDATFEEAQAIIAEAVAVVPWVPEEAGIAGNVSSRT